jgi:hypothetical protein
LAAERANIKITTKIIMDNIAAGIATVMIFATFGCSSDNFFSIPAKPDGENEEGVWIGGNTAGGGV